MTLIENAAPPVANRAACRSPARMRSKANPAAAIAVIAEKTSHFSG